MQVINELNRRDNNQSEPLGEPIVAANSVAATGMSASAAVSSSDVSTNGSGSTAAGEPLIEVLYESDKVIGQSSADLGDDVLDSIASANTNGGEGSSGSDDRSKSLQSAVDAAMAKLL